MSITQVISGAVLSAQVAVSNVGQTTTTKPGDVDAKGKTSKVTDDKDIAKTGKKETEDPNKLPSTPSAVQAKASVDKEVDKTKAPISGNQVVNGIIEQWKKDTNAKPVDDTKTPTTPDSTTSTTTPSSFTGHSGTDYSKPISNDTSSVAKQYDLANVPDSSSSSTSTNSASSSQGADYGPNGLLGGSLGGINSGNFMSGNTIITNNGNGGNVIGGNNDIVGNSTPVTPTNAFDPNNIEVASDAE